MNSPAITVKNLSKQYRLGLVGTGTLSHDLHRMWARLRGKPDPYLKVGEVNDRTKASETDLVWALKDINFEIQQGEVVGIIGKNGAGKSTLLKILTQITSPTTGTVEMRGRVGALLEVGTGFHPELTGRENIFLNGAILGMRTAEIKKKLDEIVDFSGVEKYLDTPVKRYSSGMQVRLGFAVAAHLDPEILIVDEVLAVGDIEFQRKCISKIGDISKSNNRTILLVSHNMSSIRSICDRAIVMNNGGLYYQGDVKQALNTYFNLTEDISGSASDIAQEALAGVTRIQEFEVCNKSYKENSFIDIEEDIQLRMKVAIADTDSDDLVAIILVRNSYENIVFVTTNESNPNLSIKKLDKKNVEFRVKAPGNLLKRGLYKISFVLRRKSGERIDKKEVIINFVRSQSFEEPFTASAIVSPKVDWSL